MSEFQGVRERLKAMYIQNGVLDEKEEDTHLLYERCPDADACWPSKETACEQWSFIQRPYIGCKYHLGKILFVGLNLREYGGWKALDDLFDGEHGVKWALRNNMRRMNFGNTKYKGTLLFHRLAVYAHLFLYPNSDPFTVVTPQLADTCDYVAFLEAIKCSPYDKAMSRPIGEMQTKCPQRYLFREIEILDPHTTVFFHKNTFDLFANCNEAMVSQLANGKVSRFRLNFNGHSMNVFHIVHPASRGGASISICSDLKSALLNAV